MKRIISKKLLNATGLIILTLGIASCGGGSGGGSSNVDTVDFNKSNAGNILAGLSSAAGSSTGSLSSIASATKKKVLATGVMGKKLKSLSVPCAGGGTMSIDGIDVATGEITNKLTINFNKCKIDDGTYFESASMSMTPSANGDDFTNMNFTIHSGYATDKDTGEKVEYKDFNFSVDGIGRITTMRMNGFVKASECFKGWLEIITLTPVKAAESANCPTSGKFQVKGGSSSMTVTYNSDESIDVNINGSSQHYDNCEDLPASCK